MLSYDLDLSCGIIHAFYRLWSVSYPTLLDDTQSETSYLMVNFRVSFMVSFWVRVLGLGIKARDKRSGLGIRD